MEDFLTRILKQVVKEMEEDQKNFDCDIHIKRRNGEVTSNIQGNLVGIITTLKTTLNNIQKKYNISDKDLEEMMKCFVIGSVNDD